MPDGSHRTGNGPAVPPEITREAVGAELQRFVADVMEKAGGSQAVADGLRDLGFGGRNGPFDEQTIRTWRSGARMPGADVLFALANRFEVSIDHYAFGRALGEEFERMRRRLEALGAGAA